MTQEDKELLLKDLCARLPYDVKIELTRWFMNEGTYINTTLESDHIEQLLHGDTEIKPYLRPMSSMTDEEKKGLNNVLEYQYYSDDSCMCESTDWLNAHHFDYRSLIEKGLAIAVTDDNNPYKE